MCNDQETSDNATEVGKPGKVSVEEIDVGNTEEFKKGIEFITAIFQEERDKLRAALKPFAGFGDRYSKVRQVDPNHRVNLSWRFEDFAHASKVYKETE